MRRTFFIFLLLSAAGAAADVVYLKDGTRSDGKVTMCDEEVCVVDRKRIEVGAIARIVFDPVVELPFAVRGVVLTDGHFRGGTFGGLNLGYVELNGEDISRDGVAAIILTPIPRPAEETPGPPIVRPTPPEQPPLPQPPSETPPPQTQPPLPPTPPVSQPPSALPPCDARMGMTAGSGVTWSGRGRVRQTMGAAGWRQERDAEFEVQLREHCQSPVLDLSVSPPRTVGKVVTLWGSATERETFLDHRGGLSPCTCDGEKTHRSSTDYALIWQRSADGDTARGLGFQLPSHRRPIYQLHLGGAGNIEAPCRGESCGGIGGGTMLQLSAGRTAMGGWDPEERTLDGGIMRGTYSIPLGPATHQVSWSVCRAGVQCPPPPEFPGGAAGPPSSDTPPDDPCARAGQQQALADTCRLQLDAMVTALEPLFAEYNGLMAAVSEDRAAFEAMQNYCLAYDIAQEILQAIITGGTGPSAEAAQALLHLRSLIGKIQSGSIVEEFYPSEVKKVLDMYRKTQDVWFELTADDVTRMQRDVEGCSGKAPVDTYMAAKRFVDNLAASRQLWDSRVAPAINNVRGKGQECATRNHAAWRACHETAQCRGETPACGPEPSLEGAYDQ